MDQAILQNYYVQNNKNFKVGDLGDGDQIY